MKTGTVVMLSIAILCLCPSPLEVGIAFVGEPEVVYYDVPLPYDIQHHLFEVCEEWSVPVELVLAIISVESEFNWQAKSSTGDYGLMQINECNLGWLRDSGMTNIFDPRQNISAGVHILSMCWSDDLSETLMRF